MGTRARLGYATFDVQLRKAYFVTTLYAIRTSVHAQGRVCYIGVFVSGSCDMSIRMIRNNPGMPRPAGAYGYYRLKCLL